MLYLLAAAILVLAGFYAWRTWLSPTRNSTAEGAFPCTVASVHDGDTMRCEDGTRVRLAGIDARETDGSCAPGHPCAAAPAEAATAKLEQLALGWSFTCEDTGRTYNRRAGFCRRSDGLDLSCAMLASGTVAKWGRYWRGHRCEN